MQKADGAGLNTVQFAQKKARHSAFYKQPSKAAADQLKTGDLSVLAFPDAFPNQGGLPIQVDGQTIGGLGVSGAPSEVDEAIGHVALDALKQDRPPGLSIRLTRGPTLFASFARERPINNRPAGYQPAPQQMAKVPSKSNIRSQNRTPERTQPVPPLQKPVEGELPMTNLQNVLIPKSPSPAVGCLDFNRLRSIV